GTNPLSRKYEYEEEVYVDLDGSATVYVNAAVPALVALRGLDLPLDPRARLDNGDVRAVFETAVSHVANLSTSRRDGRRYVHVRVDVQDIRRLGEAAPFAWSTYAWDVSGETAEYRQHVGEGAGRAVGDVGWTGHELVAFRLHLPSRVTFHNAPSRQILRGNIIVWEQPLPQRLEGVPVDIDVRMDSDSILENTLSLFAVMILLVALTFGGFIWFIRSRGAGEQAD
ncbi:MAG: hypothetical protein IT180_16460, partial [Acidobacteria bacterium]|nr:hypothetical protein [Acidobacteriota bacterium]